jgi:pyridinium-3,5-biscarboxylic acid mononucleotide sulfurtransferase
MNERYDALIQRLRGLDGAVVAFSGGVDSTFLLAAAREALGERLLAVTGRSPSVPRRELADAERFADDLGVRHRLVDTDEFSDPAFRANPPDRCYHCKSALFRTLTDIARDEGLAVVLEGSNADDRSDYRPGSRASAELGVLAPMVEVGLTKADIRALSRQMGLPTWSKPAMACLASRVPYGQELTAETMARIEAAEEVLREHGFEQLRVRDHGDVARIEVAPDELPRLLDPARRDAIAEALKAAGYTYVAADLQGYRMGAMNEGLDR